MSETLRPFRLITLLEAIKLAELRNLEGSALGCNASTTYKSDLAEFLTRNVNGILAELVVGRKFDRAYLPSCNTFHKQADVGQDIEVRSTHHLNGSLILRDNDDPARRYVLVVCEAMLGFAVRGWAYGYEVMSDEWKVAGEGRPHWRYRGALRPFETLTLERPKDAQMQPEHRW
jgi:hypothetical protein